MPYWVEIDVINKTSAPHAFTIPTGRMISPKDRTSMPKSRTSSLQQTPQSLFPQMARQLLLFQQSALIQAIDRRTILLWTLQPLVRKTDPIMSFRVGGCRIDTELCLTSACSRQGKPETLGVGEIL
jgi:hypothetical protein